MLRGYILGFKKPDKETRYGSAELIISKTHNLLIDGYCEEGANSLIAYLKKRKLKELYIAATHTHYDHTDGIRKIIKDSYFVIKTLFCYDPKTLEAGLGTNRGSVKARKDMNSLISLINEAKARGIKVVYLKHGDKVELGDIKFNVYREQPTKVADDDTEAYSYINDGSLCFYFPEINYWTSGDGCEKIYDFIQKINANKKDGDDDVVVKFFQIPHHGNNCNNPQSRGMKAQGARVCWYNDLEPNGIGTEEFTAYGARRCKQNGITVLDCVGDINWLAMGGKMYIYHYGKQVDSYACSYSGKSRLKYATADIVRKVFEGKYGNSDARVTNLLDDGYYYASTQKKVSTVVNVAKDIIAKKVNYGTNEQRITNLDNKYGVGYGQLIQDEINSLLKSKLAKW